MGLLTKEQIRELIKERNMKTTSDISAMLKDLFSETMQEMLEVEMDTTLGYGKNENAAKQTDNRRNGYSKKTVVSEYGDTELRIPRDREGELEPLMVRKHQKNLTGIEEQIIALYSKGMTVRDIQDHLHQLYGITVSPTLIFNVTNKLMPLIKEWQSRPLEKTYAVVFLDAIHYKVRQEGAIVNKASYMVIGIDLDGHKDVLGMWIGEHETSVLASCIK
jgi:transposase-like protein